MNEQINIDYIGVIREVNGRYTFEKVFITNANELLSDLKEICQNPNRTILDMQDRFMRYFNHSPKQNYEYCLPYSYYSSYVGGKVLPKIMSVYEYQKKKNELIKTTRSASKIAEWNTEKKKSFLRVAKEYIQAACFASTLDAIKCDSSVLMTSHELLGWTTMNHKISEDLIITIKTNFGFGSSSYFLCNICYKGINLLPYSLLVHYYYAQVAEIKKCTRSYLANRENWIQAMEFVADVSNKAKEGDLSFVTDWLRGEIDEMIARLYAINNNPWSELERMKNRPMEINGLYHVRGLNRSEIEELDLYYDEMVNAYKATKITSALELIDELNSASAIYRPALQAADKIEEINRGFAPKLSEWIAEAEIKIESLNNELEIPTARLALVEEMLDLHKQDLSELTEKDNLSRDQKNEIRQKYVDQHPEYEQLSAEQLVLSQKIRKITKKLYAQKGYMSTLQRCYDKIDQRESLCA